MNIFILLYSLCLFIACNNPSSKSSSVLTNQTTVSETSTTAPERKEIELPVGYTSIKATYKSCAVYAGATDFYFIKEDGEGLDFRISSSEAFTQQELDKIAKYGTYKEHGLEGFEIKLYDKMIDPNEVIEGPPGANPAMINQLFWLIYNEHSQLVEVKKIQNF